MAEPRWLTDDEQVAWRSYLTATRLLAAQIDRELQRDAGIPHTYFEILVRLSEAPDRSLRMSDLADAAESSRSRLSHAVARLEEAGWVHRESCPTDRRGAFAVLTDKGFEALVAAAPGHVATVRKHLVDRLTPVQLQQLREICEAVLGGLRDEDPARVVRETMGAPVREPSSTPSSTEASTEAPAADASAEPQPAARTRRREPASAH